MIQKYIDEHFYSNYPDQWDNVLFRQEVLSRLQPGSRVLDIGAGAGILPLLNFRGLAEISGIDPDPRVKANPHLDDAVIGDAAELPWPDESFDLVFAANVCEHLADPVRVFREARRVLRPGGVFLVKTPNRWYYVALLARCTPQSFHRFVAGSMGARRPDCAFPTLYRANTRRALRRIASAAGFDVLAIRSTEGRPEYLRVFGPLYFAGLAYERMVNAFHLNVIKAVLVGVFAPSGSGISRNQLPVRQMSRSGCNVGSAK